MSLRLPYCIALFALIGLGTYTCGDSRSTAPDRSNLMSAVVAIGPLIEDDGAFSFAVNLSYPKGASYPVETVGGFDILLKYDSTICAIDSVSRGSALAGWEYFTSRLRNADCVECTTSGLIRVVAILEMNDGKPTTGSRRATGELARVHVRRSTLLPDNQVNCTDIEFYLDHCFANAISDESGNTIFAPDRELSDIVFSPNFVDRDSCESINYNYIPYVKLDGRQICVP